MMTILDLGESALTTRACSKCKLELPIEKFSKDKYQKSGYRTACKECSKLEFQKFKETSGYQERLRKKTSKRILEKIVSPKTIWAYDVFYNAKARAKKNGLQFNLTIEQLVEMAVDVCPLLEIDLTYSDQKSKDSSASIDRIDSSLGYTKDNCMIISFKANRIKNNANLAEILTIAKNLVRYGAKKDE